jgi:glutamate dehydrogenase (NAD(P)+)
MRPGCTQEEVHRLARAMSHKYGVLGLASGGAKGGIDFDPHDAASAGVLRRYISALRPVFDQWWSSGEDLGVTHDALDAAFVEAGLQTASHATIRRLTDPAAAAQARAAGVAVLVDGIALPDVIGGFGVAEAAACAAEHAGLQMEGARAVVQGFGTMGGAAARYLVRQGARLVAVADAAGTIANPRGLDVEALLAARNLLGEIDRSRLRPDDVQLARDEWLAVDAEILVPAAIGDVITAENCDRVRARLVVEAANLPTTLEAQRRLHDRGVIVIPDFVANSAAIAWWWGTMREQIAPEAEAAFQHMTELIRRTVDEVLKISEKQKGTPREAAVLLADRNLDRLQRAGAHG